MKRNLKNTSRIYGIPIKETICPLGGHRKR